MTFISTLLRSKLKLFAIYPHLDAELKKCGFPTTRKPSTPLKPFLLDARQTGYPLEGTRLDLVEQFANCYERARHDPAVSFLCLCFMFHFTFVVFVINVYCVA